MRAFVVVACLGLPASCALSTARSAGEEIVAESIARLLAHPTLRHSGTALLVVSLDRGDTVYARETDRLYTPASTLKLFTAAAALHYLGPDHRFVTTLSSDAPLAGDTLQGDLYLVGRGDPDLVTEDLAALADRLVGRGIRTVAGRIVPVADYFTGPAWGSGWMWDDGPYWYWPYSSALTLNDNTVTVEVAPGAAVGDPVRVTLHPRTGFVELRVSAQTGPAGKESTLAVERHWEPRENVIDVRGVLPIGSDPVIEVRTIEDPALYATVVLSELLVERGVALVGSSPAVATRSGARNRGPLRTIARHVSDSLALSIRNFLKVSDNLTGEQLVKVIGAEVAGAPGDYESGLAAERRFLAGEVGIDTTAMVLADGSGVSRYNLVTAGQIVDLLVYMSRREDLAPSFLAALPIAGVDGTLEDRMRGTVAERTVRAKTGSLEGVSALSGYVASTGGERLAFSMTMEFFPGAVDARRAVQDSVAAALARFRR